MLICFASLQLTSGWALLQLRAYDYLSTIRLPDVPDDSPIVVAIDEPSLADINQRWPWPRSLHAQLITQLRAAGAKAIGFDIILAEPSNPENDQALAEALGPDIVLAGDESLITTPQSEQFVRTTPLPEFTQAGAHTGIASISLSRDGVFRNIPTYTDGLAATLARVSGKQIRETAYDALVQAFGPSRTYPTVSYYQALDPDNFLPKDFFRGRTIIVGLSLQNAADIEKGGADTFATPYTVHDGKLVAGVEIQATIFDNLTNNFSVRPAGPKTSFAALLLAILLAVWTVRKDTNWFTAVTASIIVIGITGISYSAIRTNYVFVPPLSPTAAYIFIVIGQAALDFSTERRNKRQIMRAFSRYLSPALVNRLADDPSQLKLGGERRTLSILFSDVRGFTTISEVMKDEPEKLTVLINRLLTPLSDVVLDHSGTIDKYMGDCIMAFWNAPLDDADHARHSVQAALAMLTEIDKLNIELEKEARDSGITLPELRMGIGINTGDCVVGNMGSTKRFDYSCLGDSVNLASRLEGASKNYGVPLLLGEQTAMLVAQSYTIVELDRIVVKGRTLLSPIYTVLHQADALALARHRQFLKAKYDKTLSPADAAFSDLAQALPELKKYYALMNEELSHDA